MSRHFRYRWESVEYSSNAKWLCRFGSTVAKLAIFARDIVVEKKVIVELKTGRAIDPAWEKQLLNYLRATEIEVGLLFNFGIEPQFRRFVFDNERKQIRVSPR